MSLNTTALAIRHFSSVQQHPMHYITRLLRCPTRPTQRARQAALRHNAQRVSGWMEGRMRAAHAMLNPVSTHSPALLSASAHWKPVPSSQRRTESGLESQLGAVHFSDLAFDYWTEIVGYHTEQTTRDMVCLNMHKNKMMY